MVFLISSAIPGFCLYFLLGTLSEIPVGETAQGWMIDLEGQDAAIHIEAAGKMTGTYEITRKTRFDSGKSYDEWIMAVEKAVREPIPK